MGLSGQIGLLAGAVVGVCAVIIVVVVAAQAILLGRLPPAQFAALLGNDVAGQRVHRLHTFLVRGSRE